MIFDHYKPRAHAALKDFLKYKHLKRLFDILITVPAFIMFIPLGIIICIIILVDDPGYWPIFIQDRLGRDMKKFKCIKFRTMKCDTPHDCAKKELCGAERYITRFGAVLRKTSFDEFPQLWNVIKGDMSLIGPRPLVLSETDVHEKRRLQGVYTIRPGLTGLAQINGRDLVDDEEKVDQDYQYLINLSFRLDVRIFFGTIRKIIMMADISEGATQKERDDFNAMAAERCLAEQSQSIQTELGGANTSGMQAINELDAFYKADS